jgi:phospholipase C
MRPCGTAVPVAGYRDRCRYGPRVLELVISPYSRVNCVSHALTAQPAILAFIEDNWRLARIGDGSSGDRSGTIAGMFDFREPAARPLLLDPATGEPAS